MATSTPDTNQISPPQCGPQGQHCQLLLYKSINYPATRHIFYIILFATIRTIISSWIQFDLTFFSGSTTQSDGHIPSKPNHTPIIAGSVIAGTLVILSILLLIWRYKKKSTLRFPFASGLKDNSKASKNATREVKPYDLKHMSIPHASQVQPHSDIDGNEVLNSPRNSVTSTIVTTSVLTERQIQLRDETEALRDQIKILQRAVLSSNVELQREIVRMGTHIQRLESMWNSDWARGISDDPPPHYES
ncbi:hypothetical protein K435DRAFT_804847 [Dendrothele bispora CBS 962.96]|uniref:Uncharacterized protein n=1 Tax=Dendrothele bispora (strain CBS 962.96) TaxID=1314807 RepID=A0A4S8LDE3_DENBC|nr:hypothetical protein K435DRAFT_804847 [Dendrothele bispora CBS 962.96]